MDYKIVKVSWYDATLYREDMSLEELKKDGDIRLLEDFGYLLYEDEKKIIISPTAWSDINGETFRNTTIMPKQMIVEVTFLTGISQQVKEAGIDQTSAARKMEETENV